MKLSAPLYRLKRRARGLSREQGIPLHAALDRVAVAEGFARWSLLASRHAARGPAGWLSERLQPGSLMLLGARPGQGKTLLGIELAAMAAGARRRGWFFTLELTLREFVGHLRTVGQDPVALGERLVFDNADAICSGYIIDRLTNTPPGSVVVIDYLQLLDQKRENPDLLTQVRAIKAYAGERGLVVVFIAQIDRSFDPLARPVPDIHDIRLPNPLDLGLFDATCFLHDGVVQYSVV